MDAKSPALLMQEIPLHSTSSRRPPQEISVVESTGSLSGSENVTFPEAGGGATLQLVDSTRTICWRTHNNVLELLEYSLDVDLYSNHFSVTFEDSKILPGVHISLDNNQLHIACCTIHAVHHMVLGVPTPGRQGPKPGIPFPSLLSNLANFDFENENRNCYFTEQIQEDVCKWNADIVRKNKKSGSYLAAVMLTTQGNVILVNMSLHHAPAVSTINQASRMSRMWAGINPWGDAGGTETIADFRVLELHGHGFAVAVCKDLKLRVWSFDTHDLVANHDLSTQVQNEEDQSKPCILKIRICKETGMVMVYAGVADQATFLQFVMDFDTNSNSLKVDGFSTVTASLAVQNTPFRHLVDFSLSAANLLTVLWRDVEENDSVAMCASDAGIWHDVAPHPLPAPEIPLLPYRDVRESYMDYIFAPGRFSSAALARTLFINRRMGSLSAGNLGLQELKERVAAHIQNEIQEMSPEEDADDDSLQITVWSNFYQNLVQYQQVVSRSLGLTITQGTATPLVSVIKKGYLSMLAPVSVLEAVCRGCEPEIFHGILQPEVCTDNNLRDLARLLESLGNLHGYLGADFLDSILQNLCLSGNAAHDVIRDLMPDILDSIRESGGDDSLQNLLGRVEDVGNAIRMLLICLESRDVGTDFEIPDSASWPAGSHGIEILARCTARHIENRFQLSILLYITASLLENLRNQDNIQQDEDYQLASKVVKYIQVYQSLFWLSTVQTQNISQATLESTMQTLSVHDTNMSGFNQESLRTSSNLPLGNQTVLEFFISEEGGRLLQAFLLQNTGFNQPKSIFLGQDSITNSVGFLVYLMWPLGPTLTLPDFLLTHGHYTVLQRYLQKELKNWCNWCTKSRAYMLAHCHLHHGYYDKAVQSFIFASSGIGVEDYLITKLLREDEDNLHPVAQEIIYFTKVLPIFERLDLPEQVITLAQHAIQITKTHEHDPNLPTLWSSVFRQSNNLSRHCEALKAIVLNPDPDHRKDCLRTLAVSLCERKKYKTLVEFQYGDLEDDLVSILEHRARGTDLATATHNYYDLLYAFHIQRGNFRKASSAMYEQGYRIGREFTPSSSEGNIACLQKQLHCYAACINCLYLVTEDHRWILHPVGNRVTLAPQRPQGYKSPKRQSDGEILERPQTKVKIHELSDIQKESLLVEMKIKLEEVSTESAPASLGPLVSAVEISAFLCHVGLYDDAITVCTKFEIPLTPLFASLAAKCVRLSYADDKAMAEGWEWLQENETVKNHCLRGKSSTTKWTVADTAYRLLQVYLEKHGDAQSHGTQYYYSAAKALLGLSATLPAWFVDAYKNRNCPELLRLLVCFDRFEEATSLAVELINLAKTKIGTNLRLNSNARRGVWLPYTVIEQLLSILEDMRTQSEFDELYHSLNDALDDYLHIAETTSDDMVQASLQSAAIAMQS